MAGTTGIQWTDATWNAVTGCSRVSDGCRFCYAESLAVGRLKGTNGYPGLPWTAQNAAVNVVLHPSRMNDPLRWRKPRRVFVNSMSDVFHEQVPDDFLDQMFGVMAQTPQHTYQLLTKRPERMRAFVSERARLNPYDWPLQNVWLGVSVEAQREADERIPLLLDTPAAIRFISAEPLLGPVNLGTADLDWVIVGGESGRNARPFDLAWAFDVRNQCIAYGTAFFMKQIGRRPNLGGITVEADDSHGGDINEWPDGLRIREFPAPPSASGEGAHG